MRALKYDPSLLAANREKLFEKTIFIKKLPREMQAKDLHEKLEEKYGKIKSLKVSLNKDYVSREYGFVTFEDPNIAQKAVEQALTDLGIEVLVDRYCPKDKKDLRKTVNSIFVKNFPSTWNEEYLTKYFSKYGDI